MAAKFEKFFQYCTQEYLNYSRIDADGGKIFNSEDDITPIKGISEDVKEKKVTKEIIVETPEQLWNRLKNYFDKHNKENESSN